MRGMDFIQIALFLSVLILCIKPLGLSMAIAFDGRLRQRLTWLDRFEQTAFRVLGVNSSTEMNWQVYSSSMLAFGFVGFLFLYALQRLQAWLPGNPNTLSAVTPDSAFNTSISFVTNTNWQGYGGESTMSYGTQMFGLTVQNFLSAGTGLAVLLVVARGFAREQSATLGNFWVDLFRSIFYGLLPLSFALALCFVSQGVIQSFGENVKVTLTQPFVSADGTLIKQQHIAIGPVASQLAIKQIGTNGGGYFNSNSAHPFENPTPVSNFIQVISILLIPASLCYSFGFLVQDLKQGWALLAAMLVLFVPILAATIYFEQGVNPTISKLPIETLASDMQSGGNMEGKEVRFGTVNSSMWAAATTAASNGSVNSMHDSYMPLSGLALLALMQMGEVVFGGVGSGLYGLIVFAVIAVFLAGLMVGRTPEYLGKKIEAFEMKMAVLAVLLPCATVLVGTAFSVVLPVAVSSILNPGAHGFSEILYAYTSAANNNGSAFAGLSANTPYYNATLGVAMIVGRFGVMIPVLAMAGSLAAKKSVPAGIGTLPTHTPLFVFLLVFVVVVVGALSFFPALALGPIVEHLQLTSKP